MSEPFPGDYCADCGERLTVNNRWQVPPLKEHVCERCARDRLDIRAWLHLERTEAKLRVDTAASL